jgi:NAD(P)-dependent dehydrogenase (short-subunit alcohol dehydrogenase family)
MMDVNVKGIFHLLGAALKPGVLEEPGSSVHAASMFSERGLAKRSDCSSKHAVVGLAKSNAIETGKRGIRVNMVMP